MFKTFRLSIFTTQFEVLTEEQKVWIQCYLWFSFSFWEPETVNFISRAFPSKPAVIVRWGFTISADRTEKHFKYKKQSDLVCLTTVSLNTGFKLAMKTLWKNDTRTNCELLMKTKCSVHYEFGQTHKQVKH